MKGCCNMKTMTAVVALAAAAALSGIASDSAATFAPSVTKAVIERTYESPDCSPIWFGGESKAVNACAKEYCLYVDVEHADGTFTYKLLATFTEGTHGWEKSGSVHYPGSPVRKIKLYALYRDPFAPGGEVLFRNVFLERRDPGHVQLSARHMTGRPFSESDEMLVTYPARSLHSADRFVYEPIADGAAKCGPVSSLPPDGVCLWTADSMRKVTPLTFPADEDRRTPASVCLRLAKGERESAQVLVTTGAERELKELNVELTPLVDASGNRLNGTISWERLGYLARRPEYAPHPCGVDPHEKWIPEVLLPAAPVDVRKGATQGIWLTVFAGRDAKPGTYRCEAKFVAADGFSQTVPVAVEVWNFALPKMFSFPAMFACMDGFIKRHYPESFEVRRREAMDMMLDHRLDWTDISRTSPPDIEDIAYAKSRGQRHVNLLNLAPPPPKGQAWVVYGSKKDVFSEGFFTYVTNTLTPYVAELRKRNLLDGCCIYGFDEREADYYEGIDRMWRRLKGVYPDLPLITSAYMYRDRVQHPDKVSPFWTATDWHTPLTAIYREDVSDELRRMGRQVWWYTCCSPFHPYCNFSSYENPTVEGRLIPWFTHLYRSDGFLFWNVNYWSGSQPKLDERDVWFPAWNTWSGLQAPGDGVLAYPGKNGILPSIRLANLRDGSEDYDYLVMAAAKDPAAVKEISKTLIHSMTDFTRNPKAVRKARERLAGIILGNACGKDIRK